jgi:hypothetical protein
MGRPPRLLQRTTDINPSVVKQLAMSLPSTALREITWRESKDRKLRSALPPFAYVLLIGLLESGTARRGMVADRMAARECRTE